MLDFSDQPYQWFAPKRNALIARLLRLHNRLVHLPKSKHITEVRVTGGRQLAKFMRRHCVMLVFNHPTHADAAIALEATRQRRIWPTFMAAYDVFLRSRRDAFIMQRLGAFSVDREGSDSRAMKHAAEVLARPGRPLTIFPEGNVYLENDRVTPFHDGAAFLALRAQKESLTAAETTSTTSGGGGEGEGIFAVPVAIKVTHLTDIRPLLRDRINQLARSVDADIATSPSPLEALRTVGIAALHRNLKLRGLDAPATDSLRDLIDHAAGIVLRGLEQNLAAEPRDGETLIDRVRKCRRIIHEVRTDPQRIADYAAAATWVDQAMLAYRILSYSGSYVAEKPTLDRIGETVEKLTEDIHRTMPPPLADRRATVHFADPIDLRPYLTDETKLRTAVRTLTNDLECAVQGGIDQLNTANDSPGASRWDSW